MQKSQQAYLDMPGLKYILLHGCLNILNLNLVGSHKTTAPSNLVPTPHDLAQYLQCPEMQVFLPEIWNTALIFVIFCEAWGSNENKGEEQDIGIPLIICYTEVAYVACYFDPFKLSRKGSCVVHVAGNLPHQINYIGLKDYLTILNCRSYKVISCRFP